MVAASKILPVLSLGLIGLSQAAEWHVPIAAEENHIGMVPIRQEHIIKGLKRRSDDLSRLKPQDEVKMFYGRALSEAHLRIADMTITKPDANHPLILLENFDDLTESITCTDQDSKIALKFKSKNAMDTAIKSWDWINQSDNDYFFLFTHHHHTGCGPDEERTSYKITAVTYDKTTFTTVLTKEKATWNETLQNFEIKIRTVEHPRPSFARRDLKSVLRTGICAFSGPFEDLFKFQCEEEVGKGINSVVDTVEEGFDKAVDTVGEGFDKAVDLVGEGIDVVGEGLDKAADLVGEGIDTVVDVASTVGGYVEEGLKPVVDVVSSGLNTLLEKFVDGNYKVSFGKKDPKHKIPLTGVAFKGEVDVDMGANCVGCYLEGGFGFKATISRVNGATLPSAIFDISPQIEGNFGLELIGVVSKEHDYNVGAAIGDDILKTMGISPFLKIAPEAIAGPGVVLKGEATISTTMGARFSSKGARIRLVAGTDPSISVPSWPKDQFKPNFEFAGPEFQGEINPYIRWGFGFGLEIADTGKFGVWGGIDTSVNNVWAYNTCEGAKEKTFHYQSTFNVAAKVNVVAEIETSIGNSERLRDKAKKGAKDGFINGAIDTVVRKVLGDLADGISITNATIYDGCEAPAKPASAKGVQVLSTPKLPKAAAPKYMSGYSRPIYGELL
ncbi:hypothetical protein AOL_s00173g261 [Orbilia oligospora ATCC 24927]|uniref:DUF7029 domain-containing protein n=2 Tax=Orbilia oligospora TaxID=2813651 RepID=G1XP93_ARTOA|nr:hypothetical protein AOL_s00173g261 [Orbilia oligospora ATCC 24927]EGX45160.1 hypothetical protein AOL_s00173g261 [Orbilia oligospora ATCC 24927]KAF3286876.1 hypothetical protein TWF970_008710 [Orbilia oligospora]